jgi:hypothetical protein
MCSRQEVVGMPIVCADRPRLYYICIGDQHAAIEVHPCHSTFSTFRTAAFNPVCASEITSFSPCRPRSFRPLKNSTQPSSDSAAITSKPRISRGPADLRRWRSPRPSTPPDHPPAPSHTTNIAALAQRTLAELAHPFSSSPAQSWLTCPADTPAMPNSSSTASILRVDTPSPPLPESR